MFVDDYMSGFRARTRQGPSGSPALEFTTLYFEDSTVKATLLNMAVKKGLWGYIPQMEAEYHKYVAAHGLGGGGGGGGAVPAGEDNRGPAGERPAAFLGSVVDGAPRSGRGSRNRLFTGFLAAFFDEPRSRAAGRCSRTSARCSGALQRSSSTGSRPSQG